MNKKDLKKYEDMLLKEKADLESELQSIAKTNPRNKGGWEATSGEYNVDSADENEVADKFETLEENEGITEKLEDQLTEVNDALAKIKKGAYGICEIGGEPIEKNRLDANPSAKVCMRCINMKKSS